MIADTVCGKPLKLESVIWATRYHGQTFYFCSLMCRERFEQEPEDYGAAPRQQQLLPPVVQALR